MNWKRIGRAAFALLVVCCLIINMSPLRVHAAEVEQSRMLGFNPLGIVGSLILNTAGVVFGDITYEVSEALGNSLGNFLRDWGEATGISDTVNTWLEWNSAITFRDKDKLLELPGEIMKGLVKWICDIILKKENIEVAGDTAPEGYAYYNGLLLPDFPEGDYLVNWILYNPASGNVFLYRYTYEVYLNYGEPYDYFVALSSGKSCAYLLRGSYWDVIQNVSSDSAGSNVAAFDDDAYGNIHWFNSDLKDIYGNIIFYGSEPTDTATITLTPSTYVGDIPGQVQDGTLAEDDITLPGYIDYGAVLSEDADILDSLNSVNQSLANGTLTHEQYLDQTIPPVAVKPVFTVNWGTDTVTYEVGAVAEPLTVTAHVSDGGTLSYQWQVWKSEGAVEPAIHGAIEATFVPPTTETGTFHYYCVIKNTNSRGLSVVVSTSEVTVEVVAKAGTDTDVGTTTDSVTATGLKSWLDNMLMGFSNFFDSAVTGLLEGIKGLFIPDAEAIAAQQDQWTALLSDRFGVVYEAGELIQEAGDAFASQGVKGYIDFPSVTIPLGDADFTFGGWRVDVVPDGFEFLIDVLKTIINIVCTFAFINAMKNRFDRVVGAGL